MRDLGKIIAALTFGFVYTPAFAADGIKATGVASRTAPADIVNLGFQIAEPSPEPGQEKNASELNVLVKAFDIKGIKVLERDYRDGELHGLSIIADKVYQVPLVEAHWL
jgi:hypothetical protein